VTVAVFSFQLYERLTVSSRAYGESALLPLPDDEVLFGLQLFQQRYGSLLFLFVIVCLPVGEKDGADGVDDE
jgi:hypothetical protein